MRLSSIHIENYRAFLDETLSFDDYTCLVGCNGSGKSTVLCALNTFFRESTFSKTDLSNLDIEDFHRKDTSNPIRITLTFKDLNSNEQNDFAHYYRAGQLSISAEAKWNEEKGKAEVKQYGQRMIIKEFKSFFEAESKNQLVSKLKQIYQDLKINYNDLPSASAKQDMINALRSYENEHPDLTVLTPSGDEFYGYTKGANKLAKYIQWVYIPAVKDATDEDAEAKNTALGKLLARTVRSTVNFQDTIETIRSVAQTEYSKLIDSNQTLLDDLSTSLGKRLALWSHSETSMKVTWQQEPEKAIKIEEPIARILAGEGLFEGNLARFGHGLQRSFLLALLQELASVDDGTQPRLILAVEEPELYQHPPQAKYMATVLKKLTKSNSQVILCTHSPYFISGEDFSCVRLVRKNRNTGEAAISSASPSEIEQRCNKASTKNVLYNSNTIVAKIHQSLTPELNEMFFTQTLILVEGLEDVAYLTTYLHLCDEWEGFRRLGCHIVPTNCKSKMLRPLVIAQLLNIPTYVIFDSDGDLVKNRPGNIEQHRLDNSALLSVLGHIDSEPFPCSHLWLPGCTVWKSNMKDSFKNEIGTDKYKSIKGQVELDYGQSGDLEKNQLFISDLLVKAWENDVRSPSLIKLCKEVIAFAKKSH